MMNMMMNMMMKNKYSCPVCGYGQLISPPNNWNICPCCYVEFGYSDVSWSYEELRNDWIKRGMKWSSENISPPLNWNPVAQLQNIKEKS